MLQQRRAHAGVQAGGNRLCTYVAPVPACRYSGNPSTSGRETPRHVQLAGLLQTLGRPGLQRCQAGKDSKPSGPGEGDEARKADFSAYWSLKVREFFSSRRQYLEGGKDKQDQRPDFLVKLNEKAAAQQALVSKLEAEAAAAGPSSEQVDQNAAVVAAQVTAPLEKALLGQTLPADLPSTDPASVQLRQAQRDLHVGSPALALTRATQLVKAILLAPFTLVAAAYKAWQETFHTQKYEMFLMSEGERVWFWRNRMENERWFWEMFAWDRLLFPILCTVAYQYVAPANLFWVVVVPSVFIAWQSGSLPTPKRMDFWLILYFGVYKKCWPDILALGRTLFCWA